MFGFHVGQPRDRLHRRLPRRARQRLGVIEHPGVDAGGRLRGEKPPERKAAAAADCHVLIAIASCFPIDRCMQLIPGCQLGLQLFEPVLHDDHAGRWRFAFARSGVFFDHQKPPVARHVVGTAGHRRKHPPVQKNRRCVEQRRRVAGAERRRG
jgi:hypothetical protein